MLGKQDLEMSRALMRSAITQKFLINRIIPEMKKECTLFGTSWNGY